MTDCEKIMEMLSAYYDGELSAGDAELVRRHLDTCESCAALLRLFGDVTGTLTDSEPPAELRERVMKSVLETAPVRAVNTNRIALRRIMPVAACLAVVLLALSALRFLGGPKADSGSASIMESSMQDAASPAASAENSYLYGEITENFTAEMAETEEDYAYDAGNGAEEPKNFSGGAYDAPDDPKTAKEPSTEPWSPDGPSGTDGSTPPQTPQPAEVPSQPTTTEGGTDSSATRAEDFSAYYAVIKFAGEFPPTLLDKLDKNHAISYDPVSGEQCVIVPRDIAEALIAEGYDYEVYNADAAEAVVILAPGG